MTKRMGLQKKSILMVGAILLFTISINTIVLIILSSNKLKSAIFSKTAAIGESIHRDITKVVGLGVPLDSLEGFSEKLSEVVARDKTIGYALVMDQDLKVLFHSDKSGVGKQFSDEVAKAAAVSNHMLIQSYGNYYDLTFPIANDEGRNEGVLRIGVVSTAIKSQLFELFVWAAGISLICFIVSIGLVYVSISRFITKPITRMELAAEKIAAGDLTSVINVRGGDEIASLGEAINRMAYNLKDMLSKIGKITGGISNVSANIASSAKSLLTISDVQKKAVGETSSAVVNMNDSISRVSGAADSLSGLADSSLSSIVEMTASIEKIAENANIFNATAQDTATSIEEMAVAVKQIADSIEDLSDSSGAIASSVEEVNATTRDIEHRANESVRYAEVVVDNASNKGLTAAGAAMQGIEDIKQRVSALSRVINDLGNRTKEISKIVNVIDEVADQTNLLALNAAILASRAGEHGKGFAVVADEIKGLAERTSLSTNEIAVLIRSVQDMTRSSVVMASEGIVSVEKGLDLFRGVSGALSDIVDSSKASADMAKAIQKATTEEAFVIKQITTSIERMAEQIDRISLALHEQSKGSRLIVEATERVKALSQQVKNATGEQKDNSRIIASAISDIPTQAVQIADATGSQKQKSSEIISFMDELRQTTENLVNSSNEMNRIIGELQSESLQLTHEFSKFKV